MFLPAYIRASVFISKCGIFLVAALLSNYSHAVLTDSLTVGNAKSLALGNAVTADPPGIDSIHFNPAGLAALKGRQKQLKVVAAGFGVKLKFGDYSDERKAWQAEKQAKGIYPEHYFDDEAHNTTSETAGAAVIIPGLGLTNLPVMIGPMGGFSYNPPGSDATFASAVYTPLMAGFYREEDDPGRFIGQQLSFMALTYFSPSFGYQFNEEFSIGAAMTFNYVAAGIDLPFRSGGDSLAFLNEIQAQICPATKNESPLCGTTINVYDQLGELKLEVENPMTIGFNVGALWHPKEWVTFGLIYQSPIPMKMKGEFTWTNSQVWNDFIGPLKDLNAYQVAKAQLAGFGIVLPQGKEKNIGTSKVDMEMPEHYGVGMSLKLTPKIKFNLDYKFTKWSVWQGLPVQFSETIDMVGLAAIIQPDLVKPTSLTFPFGLKDTWNWGAGVEYQYNDQLALRLGIEDRPSSIPREARSPLLPIGSGKLYGTGIGYKPYDGAVLDVSLGYFKSKVTMPGGTSTLGNSLNPYLWIYNPFPGTDIEADLHFYLLETSYTAVF